MKPEDLINWGELSRILTGDRMYLRKNRIPNKYKKKIDRLKKLLTAWNEWQEKQ